MRYAHYDDDIPEPDLDPDHVDHPSGEHLPAHLIPAPTDEADQ